MDKKITYKEAIDMLNGLCEGLGDIFNKHKDTLYFKKNNKQTIITWLAINFWFYKTPEGIKGWGTNFKNARRNRRW